MKLLTHDYVQYVYIVKIKIPYLHFLYRIAIHHKKSNIFRSLDLMASIFCLCVLQHLHTSNFHNVAESSWLLIKNVCVLPIVYIGRLTFEA